MMGMTALATVVSIAWSATSVATMLGISCGIDYAAVHLVPAPGHILAGHDPAKAAGRAAGTAGKLGGVRRLSVIIALGGLSVGLPFLTVMGLAAAGTVLSGCSSP